MIMSVQESRFIYRDFPCVVLFSPNGYRMGYVGIPKRYNVDFGDKLEIGYIGITYNSCTLAHQSDEDIRWIGFDCGHSCDGIDIEKMLEYYSENRDFLMIHQAKIDTGFYKIYENQPVRSQEFVEHQCRKLVDDLIKNGINPS